MASPEKTFILAEENGTAGKNTDRRSRWIKTGLALAVAAAYVRHKKKQTEWENPPQGKFIHVGGVRLHYVERGTGTPLVLLHGAVTMGLDFCMSGLFDMASRHYRVIVFDRPGYGYSERPRTGLWGPQAQAKLLHEALQQIGASQAIVLGHSWGSLVALYLALDYPESVRSLILAGGYYYPSLRAEVPFAAQRLIPVIGDVMRYTTTPIMMRLMWPLLLKRIFHPNEVPEYFREFPAGMMARPRQIRASAEEFTYAIPSVISLGKRYAELRVPLTILAGSEDRIAYVSKHSARLHAELPESELRLIPGAGHMVHHVAPEQVMEAVDKAARESEPPDIRVPHENRAASLH